jgi:membrane protein implicated in regulation of membrane protease activity
VRRRPDGEPGELVWLLAVISMVLPWAGVGLGIVGGWELYQGNRHGYWWLTAGVAMLILDTLIDFVWAKHIFSWSDEPTLNARGAELVGRSLRVAEAIEGGRGKVFAGDTLWLAEGPDCPAGATVRVVSAQATVLVVEIAPGEPGPDGPA